MKFSLDNITIVGKYTDVSIIKKLEVMPLVKSFWQTPTQIYPYNFSCHNGVFIQMGHDKTGDRRIRVEFNPNRLKNSAEEKDLLQVLKFIRSAEFSRRDIACDVYNVNINDYIYVDLAARKKVTYHSGSGKLETIYFGAGESDDRMRVYDKAKQLGKNYITEDFEWTRIEAQVRREYARAMAYNPFMKIRVTKKAGAYENMDLRTRSMLEYLENHPEAWGELSKNSRSKYKKLLTDAQTVELLDLEGAFAEVWQELEAECESWLNYTDKSEGTVIKIGKTVLADFKNDLDEDELERLRDEREGWLE